MPTKPMRVYVQFPTFNQQNEEVKSLINFFMENASLFFHGKYDSSDKLDYFTGVIRSNTRVVLHDLSQEEISPVGSYELNIPYYPYFEGEQTGFPILPTSTIRDSGLPTWLLNGHPYIEDGVQCDGDDTINLGTVYKTAMSLYQIVTYSPSIATEMVEDNPFTVPVIATPKVNNLINTDTELKPKLLVSSHQEIPLQKVKIESIFDESGEPVEEGFVYDFQLRTSSFTMEYWAVDEELHESVQHDDDVFYKIGLCVVDPTDNINSIIETLKKQKIAVTGIQPGVSGTPYQFSFTLQRSTATSPYSLPEDLSVLVQSKIGTDYYLGVPDTMIVTLNKIVSGSWKVSAVMYMKLCNQSDGSNYNDGSSNHTSVIMGEREAKMNYKSTEQDTPHWSSKIGFNITDQNLDFGFIPSYDDDL